MVIDSSMRYSSGYTILTLRGDGHTYVTLPETTGFHFVVVGGGGAGGSGSSTCRGGGGGGGGITSGWSTRSGDEFRLQVGAGGGPIGSTIYSGSLIGGWSYIGKEYESGVDKFALAQGGRPGDSSGTGYGGDAGYFEYAGGAPNAECGGGGAGYGSTGSNAPSTSVGGNAGEGTVISFFDWSTTLGPGGGGCGFTDGGAGYNGGGMGGYTNVAPTAGTDGCGGGGGGGYTIYSTAASTGIGILGYSSTDPIGGGEGYSIIYTSTDSMDYYVSNAAEFAIAAAAATYGKKIFVLAGATCDFSTYAIISIQDGVSVLSNRGQTATDAGGLLKKSTNVSDDWLDGMLAPGNDVYIAGLQLEGEYTSQDTTGNGGMYYLIGIKAQSKENVEIANCELRGWDWSAVFSKNCTNTWVHHNYIHHNNARGEGYGIELYGGNLLVEANKFNFNRHSVTAVGTAGESYEVRYCLHGGEGGCIGQAEIDVHETPPGGGYYIHHNTISTGLYAFVQIWQCVADDAIIENNEINCSAVDLPGDCPIHIGSPTSDGYAEMVRTYITNNNWLSTNYSTAVGITYYEQWED